MKGRKIDEESTTNAPFRVSDKGSAGEQVADEETDYQRTHQDTSISAMPQTGGSRAESKLAGRAPNQSKSQQTIINDIVNVEGEEEPELQNAGGGQPRVRANQQNSGPRGREDSSVRGRASGQVRGEDAGVDEKEQGISNRDSRQEVQRQQKVAPGRAKSKSLRNPNQRRAS
ncbi:MAG TPA: hypothetical protein VGP65_07035 [Candidatus Angelobacter sp.]|nr:hypothetical protein [Candidatus Angelobacter sp.]